MEFDFTDEELDKVRLKYDGRGIHHLPLSFDLVEKLPGLKKLEGFTYQFPRWGPNGNVRLINRNKIIRYINFMYSRELTCIREAFSDYKQRKVCAAILAGFEYDPLSGEFEPRVEKMLMGENFIINRMIVAFVKHNYMDRYAAIANLREIMYREMGKLMGKDDVKPQDIRAWSDTAADIEGKEHDLLNGDENIKINVTLIQKIEEDQLKLRPEFIAEKIKEGKSPLGDFDFYDEDPVIVPNETDQE